MRLGQLASLLGENRPNNCKKKLEDNISERKKIYGKCSLYTVSLEH